MADFAVDSRLLTSHREPRLRDRPYARAPEGEAAHIVVVVTATGYGPSVVYGVRHHPGARCVEILCSFHRDKSLCLVDAEVFLRR
jgi:hypothetical protein